MTNTSANLKTKPYLPYSAAAQHFVNYGERAQCEGCSAWPTKVTYFKNTAAKTKTTEELSLTDLGAKILETSASAKEQLPLLKFAVFGDIRTPKLADSLIGLSRSQIETAIREELFAALTELADPRTYQDRSG